MTFLKFSVLKAGFPLIAALALYMPGQAQAAPEITPSLKKMLGALPIQDARDTLQKMVGDLKKTSCGGNLTGCYATHSGPLHLYFFTSGQARQTFLVVVDKTFPMPKLLKENVQKVMGDTMLSSPIISISTTDFDLDNVKMPPELQKVVREKYFNVNTLSFSSGVQLAARAELGGMMKLTMESFGIKGDQLTMRAAVVVPIPADLAGGAGTGAGAADAVAHGDTMKKAGADALKPEAYVEFQFAPNAKLPLTMPAMNLTDATFFINNALTFGYKGNAAYKGVDDKKIIVHFQTPLNPAGAMDLLDFQFRMATPSNFTMEDTAHVMVAMATPDPRLAAYGGGFIRNIESYKKALLNVTKPLSVFQYRNPHPAPEYRFGDSSKPFPTDPKVFNMVLLGPLAQDGPFMAAAGESVILGQKMGSIDASAGRSGLHGKAVQDLSLKLGPLGRVTIQKMVAEADIDKDTQNIRLKGNFGGQVVEVILAGSTLTINVPANCVNPFEIKTSVAIEAKTNIADVFEGQGGVNVDPAKIGGCIGKELEAAYNKIATEYKHLGGYTASAATAELKKISDTANAAAKAAEEEALKAAKAAEQAAADAKKAAEDAQKASEQARKEYEKTKNAARDVANKSSNAANNALKAAGNVFKGFGKKKRHKPEPDPLFASSVFDWDYYYDNAPDVVKAGVDLSTHWKSNGFNEGRRGSLEFDVKFYRDRYLDVLALCTTSDRMCVLKHWLDHGLESGRQGSADVAVATYLNRNLDLQRAFGPNDYIAAMEHWLDSGQEEGRNPRPASQDPGPVIGPLRVGGGGGSAWTDDAVCNGQHITGWRVYSGSKVDRLQFRYPGGWGEAHGGNKSFKEEVLLAPNEYVVRVSYRGSDEVEGVIFYTNTGRTHGNYGSSKMNGEYKVTPGQKLGCMSGRSGDRTDQLIFRSTGPR